MVIQDVTTIVLLLPVPMFCKWCRYDLAVYPSCLKSYGIVQSRDCS